MTVQINSNRKGIEVSWDPSGSVESPPEAPPGYPAHPIELPPYIHGPTDPRPSQPIELPPDIADGVEDGELRQKILDFALGNLPPYEGGPEYPAPTHEGTSAVQVFGQGQDGDWSNTAVQPNDGLAFLSYPKDFSGESYIEVRGLDGTLVDSGVIEVE